MANTILFATWNRPEMLQIVIEHIIEARNYYDISNLKTIFAMDYSEDPKMLEVVQEYPFEKEIIMRSSHFGLSMNILEGLKYAMDQSDDYVFFQADDICVHKTYYKFIEALTNTFTSQVSSYSGFGFKDGNKNADPRKVYKGHHYDAAGAVLTKEFFEKHIRKHANENFYKARRSYVIKIDTPYRNRKDDGYKFWECTGNYNEQAGLINRLTDVAMLEDDMWIIKPGVSRGRNIGFYGKNRSGFLLGNSFEERLDNLREITKSRKTLYEMTGSKQYNDYRDFHPNVDSWDGTVVAEEIK